MTSGADWENGIWSRKVFKRHLVPFELFPP